MKKAILSLTLLTIIFAIEASTEKALLPTNLEITVIDGLGNYVEGATVSIFTSKDDYLGSGEPVMLATTDEKGKVKFKKLEPIIYYIDARKGDMNNDGEGVATEALQEGRTNKVNVVIE